MERGFRELEPYSIPSYSSWFAWNNIHEVERFSLREFFDGSSITRSPRIYKEYRDFIVSKYREDPSRKLTFTEVRKSLVGDVSILHKVFTFLEKWGLINFEVKSSHENNSQNGNGKMVSFGGEEEEEEGSWKGKMKMEEGAPYGVRVVAAPNSMKPVVPPPPPPSVMVNGSRGVGEAGESGFKFPSLASYSDVYSDLVQQKNGLVCQSCKENCDSVNYEYTKEGSFILCEKCFKSGNYEDKSADDFKFKSSGNQSDAWTETETLLLLESVLKHGDDWDLVAQNVQTKSKLECISKLMQLPFGDLMLGSAHKKSRLLDITGDVSTFRQTQLSSIESQESVKAKDHNHELEMDAQQNEYTKNQGQPVKRLRKETTSDASSLMSQVVRISSTVGLNVTASAAEAALTALCYENQCSRAIFDEDDNDFDPNTSAEIIKKKRAEQVINLEEDESPKQSEIQGPSTQKDIIQVNLRTRAATATALGAAAAHAKCLADQEEREIQDLMSTIIEAQLNKLQRKMKCFEDLETIMEKEHARIEELEESLVAERIDVLQRIFDAGISRWRDQASLKSQTGSVQ